MKKMLLAFSAQLCALTLIVAQTVTTVNYTSNSTPFLNPDIGFYYPIHVDLTSSYTGLDQTFLNNLRTVPISPFNNVQGNYSTTHSLVYLEYKIPTSTTIANLQLITTDLNRIRIAGLKVILRFIYNDECIENNQSCVGPYYDANEATILGHINQLSSIFNANVDVITVVQLGFIGLWGETYYTDHFGVSALPPIGAGYLSNANWLSRNNVLMSLLNAVPKSRMVQVRYVQTKQRFLLGASQSPSSSAGRILLSQAYNGSNASRIGFYDDCMLLEPESLDGMAYDYGNDSNQNPNIFESFFVLLRNDTKYTPYGGETCGTNNNSFNTCSGNVSSTFDARNLSFLNSYYSVEVINQWANNCFTTIARRMGYRFRLLSGEYPTASTSGSTVNFSFKVTNDGYAAPFNARQLRIVLRNSAGQTFSAPVNGTNIDTRFWFSKDTNTVVGSFVVPAGITPNVYQAALHFADTSNNGTIANRPEYSIRLANNNVWESTTGFNNLNWNLNIGNVIVTAPAKPTNVVATQLGTSVKVTWTDNANNELTFAIRKKTGTGSWVTLASNLASNTTSFTDNNIVSGTSYQYSIRAQNSAGNSTYTSSNTITPNFNSIVIDGNIADWANINAYSTSGNGGLTSLKVYSTCTDLYFLVQGTLTSNRQLFLNVDNNNATGYNDSWNGLDFMFENNILYKSTINGSVYNNNFQAVAGQTTIQTANGTNMYEVKIPKALLSGLTANIRVGFRTLNNNWGPQGKIPSGTTPPLFTQTNCAVANDPVTMNLTVSYLYPNPASTMVNISLESEHSGLKSIYVLDNLGRVAKTIAIGEDQQNEQRFRIDVSDLSTGLYNVQLVFHNKVENLRLVVNRQ